MEELDEKQCEEEVHDVEEIHGDGGKESISLPTKKCKFM